MVAKAPIPPDALNQLPCLCALLRKAQRVVTRQYDALLKSTGLRITQYSMLMQITFHPDITVSQLSDLLRMDQTTVTRNLRILEKLDFIVMLADETDQRIRKVRVTEHGSCILKKSRPAWEAAQKKFAQTLGIRKTQDLIDTLQQLIEV